MAAGETGSAAFTTDEHERRIPKSKVRAVKNNLLRKHTLMAHELLVRAPNCSRAVSWENDGGAAASKSGVAIRFAADRRIRWLIT